MKILTILTFFLTASVALAEVLIERSVNDFRFELLEAKATSTGLIFTYFVTSLEGDRQVSITSNRSSELNSRVIDYDGEVFYCTDIKAAGFDAKGRSGLTLNLVESIRIRMQVLFEMDETPPSEIQLLELRGNHGSEWFRLHYRDLTLTTD